MKKPIVSKKEQLYKEITTESKIIEFLFRYPYHDFTLTEIAKETKVSKSTASRVLSRLKEAGFITINVLGKSGHIWRIQANYEHPLFIREKIIRNLGIIYRSGIVDYINDIFKYPKAIVLFGSFRKGEDSEDSDIDIAIETDEDIELKILEIEDFKVLETKLERKIKIYRFNRKKIDLNLFNNIANGIILSGFLEVKK